MYKLILVSLILLFIGFNPWESIVFAQASKKLKSNMIDQGEFNPALKGIAVLKSKLLLKTQTSLTHHQFLFQTMAKFLS
jgi:hypothetical protein